MGRILGVAILIGGVFLVLNREKVSEFKRDTIEAINPAVKEKRLIGEIQGHLNQLDNLLAGKDLKTGSPLSKEVASIVNNAQQTLGELQQTNEKLDLGANLSHLFQKVLPLADRPSPTWLPPTKECVK